MNNIGIIIPTYNEEENIERLVESIRSYIPNLKKKKSTIFEGMRYKPGFIEQYKEVKQIILNKNKKTNLCNLEQSIKVLNLIENILKKKN